MATNEEYGSVVMDILKYLREVVLEKGQFTDEDIVKVESIAGNKMGLAGDEPPYFPGRPRPGGKLNAEDAAFKGVTRHLRELEEARAAVAPVLGEKAALAFDSAATAYATALRHMDGSSARIHPDALKEVFLARRRASASPSANRQAAFDRKHPNVSRVTVL